MIITRQSQKSLEHFVKANKLSSKGFSSHKIIFSPIVLRSYINFLNKNFSSYKIGLDLKIITKLYKSLKHKFNYLLYNFIDISNLDNIINNVVIVAKANLNSVITLRDIRNAFQIFVEMTISILPTFVQKKLASEFKFFFK
jgi:hypothetical protein